jgi:capsular polysaccharide transport system permease protein
VEIQSAETLGAPTTSLFSAARKGLASARGLFILAVFLPTLTAALYFGLYASDIYRSESRFVVRSADRQAVTPLGALLKGAGFSRSQDDTYSVHEYMRSRDAVLLIGKNLDLKQVFGGKDVDLFNRFDPIGLDGSDEAMFRFYQGRLELDVDGGSAISSLKVTAFSADDAFRINSMLLEAGEQLVNRLNERGQQDLIRSAASEVQDAESKVQAAGIALAKYRGEKAIFDPDRQSALQLQLISKLQDEQISAVAQVEQVRKITPQNPQLPALKERAKALQVEIDKQLGRVTGRGKSFSKESAEYQRLVFALGFAEKQLGLALAGLEQAKSEARRKQLYLERIVQPGKPDVAVEPRRVRAVFATFVLGLLAWGVLTLLLAGVREHRD